MLTTLAKRAQHKELENRSKTERDFSSLRSQSTDQDRISPGDSHCSEFRSVAWQYWLGDRKGIWPVKTTCTSYPQKSCFGISSGSKSRGGLLMHAHLEITDKTTVCVSHQILLFCIIKFKYAVVGGWDKTQWYKNCFWLLTTRLA